MSLTPSSMLPLGTIAPDFLLTNTVNGERVSLHSEPVQHGRVIVFMCNHCPYVIHLLDKLLGVARDYQAKGIQFVAINANDIEAYPEDAPDKMRHLALEKNFSFPYLYDETQQTAKAYHAECTPDFFVFDKNDQCVYRGRFDASTPGNGVAITGEDLTKALDALINSRPIDPDQQPSMGCNIKWKA